MMEANDDYHEYLCHKRLYYDLGNQVITDHEFDLFEKEYRNKYGHKPSSVICMNMVDWDPEASRTARVINNLSESSLLKKARKLVKKRKIR